MTEMAKEDADRLVRRLLAEQGLDGDALAIPRACVVLLVAEAADVGRRLEFAEMGPERACRVCGCTENRACAGGCSWVAEDLCSTCAPEFAPHRLYPLGDD